jgi:VanZ family protein
MRLLVECARSRPSDAAIQCAVTAVGDWNPCLDQAARHGMAPLLYSCLSQAYSDTVPPPILGRLRERFDAAARANLRLAAELVRLASLFDRAGIQVVPFKGPVVAWSLYESPALREMSDLDLLVHPDGLSRAIDLLVSAGYRALHPYDRRFVGQFHEVSLVSDVTRLAVDLHWSLAPSSLCHALDVEGIWARLMPVQVAGLTVQTLGNQDLLAFLCIHGAKHEWRSLHWLADLARLVDQAAIDPAAIDWEILMARARARQSCRMVFAGLLLVVDLLGANIPPAIVARLRAHAAAVALAARLRRRILEDSPALPTKRALITYQLALLERPADKLRFCANQLAPAITDRQALTLPAPLFPLYYVFRPLRLLAVYSGLARLAPRMSLLRLVWLVSLAAVIVGSLVPAQSPVIGLIDRAHLNDKVQHFTAYAVLAALPALDRFRCRRLGATIVFLFLLGAALEIGQLFSPGRSCDWHDLLANVCGILAGIALVRAASLIGVVASPTP